MPQASDEARARYRARFGDIGAGHAVAELKRRGYTLTKGFDWTLPAGRIPTAEEHDWMAFLVDEWDFGWWKPAPVAS